LSKMKMMTAFAVLIGVIAVVAAFILEGSKPATPERTYYNEQEALAATSRMVTHVHPTGRGKHGSYSWSPAYTAPFNLSKESLAWSWSHPEGRYWTLTYGTVLDHELNIYLSAADAIRKFSPDGKILWEHRTLPAGRSMDTYALWKGALYGSRTDGVVFGINIENGNLLWTTKVCNAIPEDNGFANVQDGIVVVCSDPLTTEFPSKVRGINATDGTPLWVFEPDKPVWNFMASFPGDGSVVFQDIEGKAYRLILATGELIWKAGGNPGTWTDGTLTLGPDNVVYAVACRMWMSQGGHWAPGDLWAYRLTDGKLLWQTQTPRPPNVAPAVGKLYQKDTFSVVQAIGQQVQQGAGTDVYAYDAETGAVQWKFAGPAQQGPLQAGDLEGQPIRDAIVGRGLCLPNPWSAPAIDAAGTVYVGNQDGLFFALRDVNGDGTVEGPDEVSSFDTKAAFAGSAGPSLGPGMVVAASCDSLFVFREP